MKIICDCGNEVEFNNIDEDTNEETSTSEDEGQYVTIDCAKFSFWEQHDVVGIVCKECDKAIWLFT